MTRKTTQAQRDWASGGYEGFAYGSIRLSRDIDLNTMAWSPDAAARHRAAGKLMSRQNFIHNAIGSTRIC